jgi:hypothetical protein
MKTRIVLVSFVVILSVLAFVNYSGLLADPPGKCIATERGQTVADTMTSVKEREAMGLDQPTWTEEHGKVQPQVRVAIKHEQDLETNMDKDLMPAMYKFGRPVGFLSTVYVAVHLRVEQGKTKEETRAAIRDVQNCALRQLTAAEFSVFLRFEDHPAILGYANEAGLAKLAKINDVIAIGLDAKPIPRDSPRFHSQGVAEMDSDLPKVSAQVRAALQKVEYVYVIVILKQDEVRGPKDLDEIRQARKVQDRVLTRLTAEDFRSTSRSSRSSLHGYVNTAGLNKLNEDPDVVNLGLTGPPIKRPGFQGRKP